MLGTQGKKVRFTVCKVSPLTAKSRCKRETEGQKWHLAICEEDLEKERLPCHPDCRKRNETQIR